MAVARMRAEAEDAYGSKLGEIEGATNRIPGGFQKDDGASVKKVHKRHPRSADSFNLVQFVAELDIERGSKVRSRERFDD